LHLQLKAQSEELIDSLLQDITVLELPQPGVQTISELVPGARLLFVDFPGFKDLGDLFFSEIRNLSDDTLILHELAHNFQDLL